MLAGSRIRKKSCNLRQSLFFLITLRFCSTCFFDFTLGWLQINEAHIHQIYTEPRKLFLEETAGMFYYSVHTKVSCIHLLAVAIYSHLHLLSISTVFSPFKCFVFFFRFNVQYFFKHVCFLILFLFKFMVGWNSCLFKIEFTVLQLPRPWCCASRSKTNWITSTVLIRAFYAFNISRQI